MSKMHDDEVEIEVELVRQLLASQCPQWAQLPLRQVLSAGTSNAMFRLGDALVVRLPRIPSAALQVGKEQRWLSWLASYLPLSMPQPLAAGRPEFDYPFAWSVYPWLPGETAVLERLTNPAETAVHLVHFLHALQTIDTANAPPPGDHNFGRGVPLAERDAATRRCLAELVGMVDVAGLTAVWEQTRTAPIYSGNPVWIHGDLQSGNLLAVDGQLSAVIDWGGLAVGDPACDLQVAWNLFESEARAAFREAMQVDEATWLRGAGWALSVAVIALPYYKESNPTLANIARFTIKQLLAEFN